MSPKNFTNPMEDYDSGDKIIFLDENLRDISSSMRKKLLSYKELQVKKLLRDFSGDIFSTNSVYTGSSGIALLYYLFAKNTPDQNLAAYAETLKYIRWEDGSRRQVTFLCGQAGPLALATVVSHRLGSQRPSSTPQYTVLAEKLKQLLQHKDVPDEMLYGRAGYLFALLFVNKETGEEIFPPALIKEVVLGIFESGQRLSKNLNIQHEVPLMYEWHDSYYLGAAHGTAGILYMLLQARAYLSSDQLTTLVEPTLQWLLRQRYPGGNLPSSSGSRGDRLVQWCHGAPGLVQLCCMAYEVFGKQEYLEAGLQCGEVVWERGLCTKGYSLCHGVAGNAYTFLQLYQTTQDPKHLYRACRFADWCIQEKEGTELHRPDAPASLCEGLAGRLYFIEDMLRPNQAKFPAYTL